MIVTRRFWLTTGLDGPAAIIDVRTNHRIGSLQAEANAKSLFRRKTDHEPVFCQQIQLNSTRPNYTIGPRVF